MTPQRAQEWAETQASIATRETARLTNQRSDWPRFRRCDSCACHAPCDRARLQPALGQVYADDQAVFGSNRYGNARTIHVGPRRVMGNIRTARRRLYLIVEMRGDSLHPLIQARASAARALYRLARQERALNIAERATCVLGGACAAILWVRTSKAAQSPRHAIRIHTEWGPCMSPKLSKSDAIARLCRERPALRLASTTTHFANINASKDVWWYDIPRQKVTSKQHEALDVLAYDHRSDELHHLVVSTKYLRDNLTKLVVREDKDTISLELSASRPHFLRDIRPGGGGLDFVQFQQI